MSKIFQAEKLHFNNARKEDHHEKIEEFIVGCRIKYSELKLKLSILTIAVIILLVIDMAQLFFIMKE